MFGDAIIHLSNDKVIEILQEWLDNKLGDNKSQIKRAVFDREETQLEVVDRENKRLTRLTEEDILANIP